MGSSCFTGRRYRYSNMSCTASYISRPVIYILEETPPRDTGPKHLLTKNGNGVAKPRNLEHTRLSSSSSFIRSSSGGGGSNISRSGTSGRDRINK